MFPVQTPNPRPAAARLLFVGNGPDEHLSLQRLLEDWYILSARSCAQAVYAIESERPSVIVCEEKMPDGSWRYLLGEVQSFNAPPPVIVLARNADEHLWAEVLRRGGFDVLASPLDPSRARPAICYAAEQSRPESAPPRAMRMAAHG